MFGAVRTVGLLLLCLVVNCPARDAYVLLSGGGTPLSNNYSQYLQARAVTAWLQRSYPEDSVWIFFGCGNQEGQPVRLADVRHRIVQGGQELESWLSGSLPHNRPATRESFLHALRKDILPAVRDGGTLYLLVGDHGSLTKSGPKESVITLWQLERTSDRRGWHTNEEEVLSVSDLRAVLHEGLGRGRVVFCMTQCHSGGFHFLGMPRGTGVDPAWFAGPAPEWTRVTTEAPLAVAGFTSTDEPSIAAGCEPDPEPDLWAGYERYFPESLLGLDLFSGRMKSAPRPSFAAAHTTALLVDQTVDKPRSTSEQYLDIWAGNIEHLAREPKLLSTVRSQVLLYQQNVEHGIPIGDSDPTYLAYRKIWDKAADQISALPPRGADTPRPSSPLATGSRKDRRNRWLEVVRPVWKAAFERGAAPVPAGAVEFERHLLTLEDKHREFLFPDGNDNPVLNEIYWKSGYAFPTTMVPARAEEVARWAEVRREKIHAWAMTSADPAVRAAAPALLPPAAPARHERQTLRHETAVQRQQFFRRISAAWIFLRNTHATAALAELARFQALEATALPAPTK